MYFNSQPHEEADNIGVSISTSDIISTHSLTRRLTWQRRLVIPLSVHFNSQPHEEADRMPIKIMQQLRKFQLTASRGGWRLACNSCLRAFSFQLTASRGGWLRPVERLLFLHGISTHSLTRRLTIDSLKQELDEIISTHSLTRRLTHIYEYHSGSR